MTPIAPRSLTPVLLSLLMIAGCGEAAPDDPDGAPAEGAAPVDPGSGPWDPVPASQVAEVCQLDPALLAAADQRIARPFAVVRRGRLCHEYYPDSDPDAMTAAWSATKTLGALTLGMVAHRTRDLRRTGPRTGPLSDLDRVDHWIDDVRFNKDALVAHVLAMVAHNPSLVPGQRRFSYDALGTGAINRLSDVMNAAIRQDPERLGKDLDDFVQRHLFAPLGMRRSTWDPGKPDKVLGYGWMTTVRDMARVGLLLLHRGRWAGEQLVSEDWVYRMSHPAFEDTNTAYGYLTWLNSASNHTDLLGNKQHGPKVPCAPVALHRRYPHPPSESPDCGYDAPHTCEQELDVGVYFASGLGGQYIVVHPGLDLVLVVKDLGDGRSVSDLWGAVRPALLAHDPVYKGDEQAFCAAYAAGRYGPAQRGARPEEGPR